MEPSGAPRAPTLVIRWTDAESVKLITSDIDKHDRPFPPGSTKAAQFHAAGALGVAAE